jgi:hypothetical protein
VTCGFSLSAFHGGVDLAPTSSLLAAEFSLKDLKIVNNILYYNHVLNPMSNRFALVISESNQQHKFFIQNRSPPPFLFCVSCK